MTPGWPTPSKDRGGGARRADQSGFTLVEVLVALAVAAAVLTSIGALAGTNARGSRTLEQRAALMETARAVETGIPPRAALALGRLDGKISDKRWRMDVRPMSVAGISRGAPWRARDVLIRVEAASGEMMVLQTVRLVRSPAP